MPSKDSYSMFDSKKIIGKTSSGRPYLRPSNPRLGQGLDSALNKLRRPGNLEGANLSKSDAKEIKSVIESRLRNKSTASFSRADRLAMRHVLESKYRAGKLSRNDIKDAQYIIDKLNK